MSIEIQSEKGYLYNKICQNSFPRELILPQKYSISNIDIFQIIRAPFQRINNFYLFIFIHFYEENFDDILL